MTIPAPVHFIHSILMTVVEGIGLQLHPNALLFLHAVPDISARVPLQPAPEGSQVGHYSED